MHPDWYRTPLAEDDVRMIGDYPAVEMVPQQLRPAYDPNYFDHQNRRYWGEPVPEDYEPLTMWSVDCETQYGVWWIVGSLGGFFGGMFLLYSWLSRIPSPLFDYTAPKELPTVAKYFVDGKIPKRLTHMSPSFTDRDG